MDPSLDPPPAAAQPTAAPAAALPHSSTFPAANPSPSPAPAQNHPPYAEMISSAITALNERDGSSKRAIAKYIEAQYRNLPPTHDALLAHHLKRLKSNGQLVMVKNSYKLPVPGSAPVAATNGAVNAVAPDPAASGSKKRRGRPPKAKPEQLQAAVPVFEPAVDINTVPVVLGVPSAPAAGPVNGPAPTGTGRGRGRPKKQGGGAKRGPTHPPKTGVSGSVGPGRGRPRGRPKKFDSSAAAPVEQVKRAGKPRGRPRRPTNPVAPLTVGVALPASGGAAVQVSGKRRGRPPRASGEAKKPRLAETKKPKKLSGKPRGRPRKNAAAATAAQTADSQLVVAYLDLKGKYENLQARVKQHAGVIRPYLINDAAASALQELESLASLGTNVPSNVQVHPVQPQQPQAEEHQHEPQPQPLGAPPVQPGFEA